ncbi:hypothetical protein [Wolbachia endosymbiont of Cantharis cryptica]|uniref:hypothetical protein n=1 Tax=Wolbachia endosymbiont of Cantharis cryptica TaxID=3066132 RepID=UPI00376EC909
MTKKKIVTLKDLKGILAAIRGIGGNDIQSKIKNKKEKKSGGMPSPQNGRENPSKWGEGLNNSYNTGSSNCQSNSNPFIPRLNKVKLSVIESIKLNQFLNAIDKVKNASELSGVLGIALDKGVRTNAHHEGQRSFADTVVLKMLSLPCTENEKEDIIYELMRSGAMFSYDLLQDKRISEIHNKLYQEVRSQIDKRLKELREVVESAIENEGAVEDMGIDSKTFYVEFSKNLFKIFAIREKRRKERPFVG